MAVKYHLKKMIYLIFPKLYHPALVLEQHGKIKMVTDVIFVFKILIETHICKNQFTNLTESLVYIWSTNSCLLQCHRHCQILK